MIENGKPPPPAFALDMPPPRPSWWRRALLWLAGVPGEPPQVMPAPPPHEGTSGKMITPASKVDVTVTDIARAPTLVTKPIDPGDDIEDRIRNHVEGINGRVLSRAECRVAAIAVYDELADLIDYRVHEHDLEIEDNDDVLELLAELKREAMQT